ncbi:TonB-dependent receptor domain-containing protein [Eilatimonas milleporae]|uniref:Outer membrane receptor for ferrienterochelin and colicins n=1 Tax=Eilatimonas milleporae TaxID=911205 RepID=A0A3M0CI43_9PROT|nr:TonB-dependent receptor [Eilatimonas milleporae]RMB02923.1 outer membrane receptor for ferrienterochelin and colicins [Eilatimonas milleporae]
MKEYVKLLSGVAVLPLCGPAFATEMAAGEEGPAVEEIVVTATTRKTDLQTAPASVSVVDKEELILRAAIDLAQALQGEEGVQVSGVGQSRNGISLRGMDVEHTLFLVDGRRIASTNAIIAHSDFELNWLPPAAIEQIEVVRGPLSSLYGSDALGGVVNVITKKPAEALTGSISLNASTPHNSIGGEEVNANLYVSAPLIDGKLGVSVFGDYFNRAELAGDLDDAVSNVEAREAATGRVNLVFTPTDNQRIDLIYAVNDDRRWRNFQQGDSIFRGDDDITMQQMVLSHTGDWNWGGTQLNLYRNDALRVNQRDGMPGTRDQQVIDTVIDGYANFSIGEMHHITIGGQVRDELLEDELVAEDGDLRARHRAVFIQNEIELTERLSLVGGFRADHHSFFGWETSPRGYIVYEPLDGLVIKGGYGEGFKAPSLRDLSPDFEVFIAGGAIRVIGNENLQPELSKTYEASISYQTDTWSVSAGVFRNELRNLVDTVCIAGDCDVFFGRTLQFNNVDLAEIVGVEASFKAELPAGFFIEANYTHLDTEDTTTGEELQNRARHSAYGALSWTGQNDLKIRLRAQYTGVQRAQAFGPAQTLPDYVFVFAEAAYPLRDNLRIVAGVDNVTDVRLAEESPLFGVNLPGREYRLSLLCNF